MYVYSATNKSEPHNLQDTALGNSDKKNQSIKILNFQESKLAPLLSTAGTSIEYFEDFEKCQQQEMSRELQLFKM